MHCCIRIACGKEIDYNGIEHPLISASNIQYLRKSNDYTEVLILRQGMYPYVAELPDYSMLDIFKDFNDADLEYIEDDFKPGFITFNSWISGIGDGTFKFPFYAQKKGKVKNNSDWDFGE